MDEQELKTGEFDFQQANELINSRQRFQRRPKKAVDLINLLLARKGYGQKQAKQELHASWSKVAGQRWQQKTMVGNINKGVLEIIVENSAALQQLNFKKRKLLLEMQNHLPQNKIQDIKFKVGKIHT